MFDLTNVFWLPFPLVACSNEIYKREMLRGLVFGLSLFLPLHSTLSHTSVLEGVLAEFELSTPVLIHIFPGSPFARRDRVSPQFLYFEPGNSWLISGDLAEPERDPDRIISKMRKNFVLVVDPRSLSLEFLATLQSKTVSRQSLRISRSDLKTLAGAFDPGEIEGPELLWVQVSGLNPTNRMEGIRMVFFFKIAPFLAAGALYPFLITPSPLQTGAFIGAGAGFLTHFVVGRASIHDIMHDYPQWFRFNTEIAILRLSQMVAVGAAVGLGCAASLRWVGLIP
ncbi:MAG: hypothetical protein EA369_07135 [Bradymonadales bacterium]|nr:MAG: hypothetical protein EA369_07135 [Bradymonadales bacterium]